MTIKRMSRRRGMYHPVALGLIVAIGALAVTEIIVCPVPALASDASEVVLLAMTERGVSKLLSTSVKLGADISIAAGPVGAGVRGETAGLSADIISFARSKGLYAGISLEGAVVATRDGLNKAYYGREVTPTDILIRREVSNPQADKLIRTVVEVAGQK